MDEYNNGMNMNSNNNNSDNKIIGMPKGVFIFLCILVGAFLLGLLTSILWKEPILSISVNHSGGLPSDDYVAVLHVEGTIQSSPSGNAVSGYSGYDHPWTMETIDELIDDDNNLGILLYVNTPGGEVYAGDELYLKLEEYKEKTGCPVYAYFANQATSCGYYIAADSDQIVANRNCLTGSIGVKVGTFVDISELLENYGVKAFDIDTGKFKSMGSSFREMSEEEYDIWQSYIDEAYEQFLEVVADGRNMDIDTVRELADGRIYTAKQAKELDLIDEIGDYDYTVNLMKDENGLDYYCDFVDLTPPEEEFSLADVLSMMIANTSAANGMSEHNPSAYYITNHFIPLYE